MSDTSEYAVMFYFRAGMASTVLYVIASRAKQSRFWVCFSGIAELVPSETRNLMLQFASATPRNR